MKEYNNIYYSIYNYAKDTNNAIKYSNQIINAYKENKKEVESHE